MQGLVLGVLMEVEGLCYPAWFHLVEFIFSMRCDQYLTRADSFCL